MEAGLHVVLGGSGAVGNAIVRQLMGQTVAVRAVNRSGRIHSLPRRVPVMAAEAVFAETLRPACAGADVIYHCMHPTRDDDLLIPVTRNVVQMAAETGALLVMAGNMDPYGPVGGPIDESHSMNPVGRLGRLYARVTEIVTVAHVTGTIRAVIGRAAHCFGPGMRRVWPGTDFAAALEGRPNHVYGDLDAPHSFMYIDDFARGLITLGNQPEAWGKIWHVPAAPPISLRAFLDLIYAAAGREVAIRHHGRARLLAGSLVSQDQDRLRQIYYQFARPFIVDHRRYETTFGANPTPHRFAVEQTMDWYRRIEREARTRITRDLDSSG